MKRKNVNFDGGRLTGVYVSRFTPPFGTEATLPTSPLRSQFNELLSLLQAFQNFRPHWFDPRKQRLFGTVSFANPDEGRRAVAEKPAVNEVLVLADDDGVLFTGVFPEHWIICRVSAHVEGMNRLMSLTADPPGKRRWELGINEKVHTAWSTA